jgi:hypothetical protein
MKRRYLRKRKRDRMLELPSQKILYNHRQAFPDIEIGVLSRNSDRSEQFCYDTKELQCQEKFRLIANLRITKVDILVGTVSSLIN